MLQFSLIPSLLCVYSKCRFLGLPTEPLLPKPEDPPPPPEGNIWWLSSYPVRANRRQLSLLYEMRPVSSGFTWAFMATALPEMETSGRYKWPLPSLQVQRHETLWKTLTSCYPLGRQRCVMWYCQMLKKIAVTCVLRLEFTNPHQTINHRSTWCCHSLGACCISWSIVTHQVTPASSIIEVQLYNVVHLQSHHVCNDDTARAVMWSSHPAQSRGGYHHV